MLSQTEREAAILRGRGQGRLVTLSTSAWLGPRGFTNRPLLMIGPELVDFLSFQKHLPTNLATLHRG